jgi:hypothetical protein
MLGHHADRLHVDGVRVPPQPVAHARRQAAASSHGGHRAVAVGDREQESRRLAGRRGSEADQVGIDERARAGVHPHEVVARDIGIEEIAGEAGARQREQHVELRLEA